MICLLNYLLHDHDFIIKFFSSSLKDDVLKGYLSLPKKSIDNYANLILQFIANFKNNIQDKIEFKDLCRMKYMVNL